jgi:hypothetical protein
VKRRTFITLLGGAAVWPLAARGQQPHKGLVRLGFLPIGSPRNDYDRSLVEAFQEGLRRVGLIENQNIVLDVAWVGDDPDQAVSEELQRGAELLITSGSGVSVAARRQTSTIPIVFLHVGDPMAMGLIESLSLPGRNATGFSDILADLSGKFVDLAIELSPGRRSDRATVSTRRRFGRPPGIAHLGGWSPRLRIGSEISDHINSDCLLELSRSRTARLGCEPQPAGWERNGGHHRQRRT